MNEKLLKDQNGFRSLCEKHNCSNCQHVVYGKIFTPYVIWIGSCKYGNFSRRDKTYMQSHICDKYQLEDETKNKTPDAVFL